MVEATNLIGIEMLTLVGKLNSTNNNAKLNQELISNHQVIGVFTTIQINQQKTPRLLDLILNSFFFS